MQVYNFISRKVGFNWRLSMYLRYKFYYSTFVNYTDIIRYERFNEPFCNLVTKNGLVICFDDVKASFIVVNEIWRNKVYTKYYKGNHPKCVVDVGANVGFFALFAIRIWPSCYVFAYEPVFENFKWLQKNKANINNKEDRLSIFNVAVSDADGTMSLNIKSGCGCHSYFEKIGNETIEAVIQVPTISLDSIVSQFGYIDFLKIDCEGCEWLMLLGKESLLRDNVGYLAMECHEVDGHRTKDLVFALKENGFSVRTDSENMLYAENLKSHSR